MTMLEDNLCTRDLELSCLSVHSCSKRWLVSNPASWLCVQVTRDWVKPGAVVIDVGEQSASVFGSEGKVKPLMDVLHPRLC